LQLYFIEEYFENGQVMRKFNYMDGQLNGVFEEYAENGQLKEKTVYNKGKKVE
jgi:antitoxin component YwqK of YwqJK toxin-antitoxin module